MGYQPLEDLLPKTGFSIYKLVRLASARAAELADGKPKLVNSALTDKVTSVALEEIRSARVILKDVEAQFPPPRKEEKSKDVEVI